jgi:putative ABC transport system permease protein
MTAAPAAPGVELGPLLAVVLVLLATSAALLVRLGSLGDAREVLVAAARATAQLALVSLLITAVLRSVGWTWAAGGC